MALNANGLNAARYASILADLKVQFPLPPDLLPAEAARYDEFMEKMAHGIADNEGTDVVAEITTNARVPFPIAVTIPITATPGNPSVGATTADGTVI